MFPFNSPRIENEHSNIKSYKQTAHASTAQHTFEFWKYFGTRSSFHNDQKYFLCPGKANINKNDTRFLGKNQQISGIQQRFSLFSSPLFTNNGSIHSENDPQRHAFSIKFKHLIAGHSDSSICVFFFWTVKWAKHVVKAWLSISIYKNKYRVFICYEFWRLTLEIRSTIWSRRT